MSQIESWLNEVYTGHSAGADRARSILLFLDVAVLVFFVVTTFLPHYPWIIAADVVIGVIFLLELAARVCLRKERLVYLLRPTTIVDLVVVLSLFLAVVSESFTFLRAVRTLRLLRSYHVLRGMRGHYAAFQRHEEVIFSALNLLVFIFVVSSLVYVLQSQHNDSIGNYIDALYFTTTTLTTTGFGDIILVGSSGRLLAVTIMIVGVTLFLRLIQTIFRATKVRYSCPDCGLMRHDADAVHCKHCGRVLHIANQGD